MAQRRIAIVTGVSGGIGTAVAETLGQRDIGVIGIDAVAGGGTFEAFHRLDLAAPDFADRFDAAIAETQADVLVNCAALYKPSAFDALTPAAFDRTMAVNVRAPFLMAQAFARHRRARGGGGQIVLVSSVSARLGSTVVDYAASKAAVEGLIKSLAKVLAPERIRVNGVAPGIVDTPMSRLMPKELLEARLAGIPLARMARPEEIAAVVDFLCSPAASYVNGQTIATCGGMT